MFVVGHVDGDGHPRPAVGPEVLRPATGIARDNGVRRGKDCLSGAIVLLQDDGRCVREVSFEFLDIADGRSAEGVDGLVGVADDA